MDSYITELAELIKGSQRIVCFTGAGLSTEFGIPDFRSQDGYWNIYDETEFIFSNFISRQATRVLYWQIFKQQFQAKRIAKPNAAHKAISRLDVIVASRG